MKTFKTLQEERGEKAFKQAMQMGLKYSGFGYWKDPTSGETKYKTENDTLIPVEQDESSELYKGPRPDGGLSDQGQMAVGAMGQGGMKGPDGMLNMPGGGQMAPGQNIGNAPEPGEEQVEHDPGWRAGPEGDTCAGPDAEEVGGVPKDSFVGRTNFLKWRAGPDGDNVNTVSYERIQEENEANS